MSLDGNLHLTSVLLLLKKNDVVASALGPGLNIASASKLPGIGTQQRNIEGGAGEIDHPGDIPDESIISFWDHITKQ